MVQNRAEKIADLCAKYDVTIISDEIHCDLTDPDKKYIPFAGISNHDSITTIFSYQII